MTFAEGIPVLLRGQILFRADVPKGRSVYTKFQGDVLVELQYGKWTPYIAMRSDLESNDWRVIEDGKKTA